MSGGLKLWSSRRELPGLAILAADAYLACSPAHELLGEILHRVLPA
jgi:hypothetical protein